MNKIISTLKVAFQGENKNTDTSYFEIIKVTVLIFLLLSLFAGDYLKQTILTILKYFSISLNLKQSDYNIIFNFCIIILMIQIVCAVLSLLLYNPYISAYINIQSGLDSLKRVIYPTCVFGTAIGIGIYLINILNNKMLVITFLKFRSNHIFIAPIFEATVVINFLLYITVLFDQKAINKYSHH